MAVVRKAKFTIVRDTREQKGKGWEFRSSKNCTGVVKEKLDVGDYSLKDLEHLICIERKTLGDLWGTLGNPVNYNRFLREWERARNHPVKYLIIEATLADLNRQYRFSRVPPAVIHAKLISLQIKHGVHVVFAGRQDIAHTYVRALLDKLYRYYLDGVLKERKDATS